jgi:uncharacterized protein YsxB (DUF464 family)
MINITFNPKTFTLDITGHAEHGEKGEDIVCSAISTLFYTLGEALYESRAMMSEDIVFSDEDGNGHLSCKPKAEYEANVSLIYWTILTGFELIEKNYKKNVILSVVGQN